MSKALKRILLVAASCCVTLGVAEAIARVVYTKPWHIRLLEEQTRRDPTVKETRNSLDLRDRDYPPEKPAGCHRVLMLGDSFTFGMGVDDDAVVFPEVLERELDAEYGRRGESVEVLNGGIPGSLTGEWLDLLEKVQGSFKPDVVLIVFFMRDGTTTASMGSFFAPIRDEIESRNADSFLYRHSYLARLLIDRRDRDYFTHKYAGAMLESYLGDEEQTQEWRNAQANLLRIDELARQGGARVGFVLFPVLVELNEHHPFLPACKVVLDWAHEHGFRTLDLLPAFDGHEASDLWVSSYNQHPNAAGHRIAADAIKPFLERLIDGREP